jgi:hypothetical protein
MATTIKKHIAALTLIMLVSALLVTQVSQPIAQLTYSQGVEQSDGADNADSDSNKLVISADLALNSSTQLNLHQEFYQIREIVLDEVADPHVIYVANELTESDHFRTLFRNVISTNAP